MNRIRMTLTLTLPLFSTTVAAQVELRLAYMEAKPNVVPTEFPNDQSFKYMAGTTYIRSSDLTTAAVSLREGRAVVIVQITESARRKINRLVATNLKAQTQQTFGDQVGLALIVDGHVHSVIQGMFHSLPSAEMQLDAGNGHLSKEAQLQEAQKLVMRIKHP